ncbi:PQQ-binding-like beta-propeller repeat protein [Actinoallomurus sp. NPDC050550]|uniref:outer membrane protein assembly factor BamB family protein n=1 Tax=Actinoallomurus sp. NPDC050550 TaxID=3154937 RepID=UPI0033FCF1F7
MDDAGDLAAAPRRPQRASEHERADSLLRRRSPWLTTGLPALVAASVLAVLGIWWFSPWEYFSGARGTPPRPLSGLPSQGADRFRDASDPVLVAGTLVERHGAGARAVDLRTGRTWWTISRPGRARVDAVGRVDGGRAAIVWSDRRLTVIDVATGRRRHADLPDRSQAHVVHNNHIAPDDETAVGFTNQAGRSLVAVIQRRGVDTYDASSGRHLWSWAAPAHCGFNDPSGAAAGASLSLAIGCELTPGAVRQWVVDYEDAYSLLLDASSGRPLPGFGHFAGGPLEPVGDHLLLQNGTHNGESYGYRVIDSRTARTLWRFPAGQVVAAGGDGLVVGTTRDARQSTVYRATDGKRLWQYSAKSDDARLRYLTVVNGQVRAVDGPRVLTFDGSGAIAGRQDFPMFAAGGNRAVIGGDYRTLVVEDMNADRTRHPHVRPYVLLTATH